jgi:hypothetical protein
MKLVPIVAFLCTSLTAQTVTFSPQGAAVLKALTGKRIKGVGIMVAEVCSTIPVSAGAVYGKASTQGIAWIDPALGKQLINRTVNISWPNLIGAGITDASLLVPLFGAAGIISMAPKWVAALISGHGAADLAISRLRTYAPDPTALETQLLDPEAMITFADKPCHRYDLLVQYSKANKGGTYALAENAVPWQDSDDLLKLVTNRARWIKAQAETH